MGICPSTHIASMGSVMAGSAFSARKTHRALPLFRAFRSCLEPTTSRCLPISGNAPHFGILLFFLVSIQKHIIRRFSKKSTKFTEKFLLFFQGFSLKSLPTQFFIIPSFQYFRKGFSQKRACRPHGTPLILQHRLIERLHSFSKCLFAETRSHLAAVFSGLAAPDIIRHHLFHGT